MYVNILRNETVNYLTIEFGFLKIEKSITAFSTRKLFEISSFLIWKTSVIVISLSDIFMDSTINSLHFSL